MKKFLLIASVPILAVAAWVVWQNLPEKRFARHVIKARLFSKEGNLAAAGAEYAKAYAAKGGYTPYASIEVLALTNQINLQENNPREALENTRKFVQMHRTNREGMVLLAGLAFQLGEVELGFDTLDSLLAIDPWNYQGRLILTKVRAQLGRFDLAEEQLRYLYGKYPDSAQALLPLAEVLLRERRSPESREFLRLALGKRPKEPRARLMLVDSYLLQGDLDSAQLMLDQWQESDPEQKRQARIRKARLYSLAGRPEAAKAALADYLALKEENVDALSELAILHAKEGRYDSALALYRSIGEISPASRATSELMAYYLNMKAQNPARALEALQTVRISDKRPLLLPPLIAAYLAIGQDNKAQELIDQQPDSLKKTLGRFRQSLLPDKEFIGQWALVSYFGTTRQDKAAYQAAKDLYLGWPRHPMAIEIWTGQLSSRGKYAEAAQVLAAFPKPELTQRMAYLQLLVSARQWEKVRPAAEALAADYPGLKGVNLILADSWAKLDKTRAMAYYGKELALDPDNAVALNNLAWEYGVVQSDLGKAGPYLEKLKQDKHSDPRIADTIGWILAVNGKPGEGERYVRNALDLVPDFPAFQYHLAYILAKSGKTEEARKVLEQALSNRQVFEERKEAEKLLAELG